MKSSTPSVSIVIPAFNAEATISEAISSALAQSHRNLEVVICDDASTDETIAKIVAFNDARIVLLRNNVNRGEGYTRDRAIAAASGTWVAMLDADDMWTPERLTRMLAVSGTEAGPEPDYLIFDDIMECHDTPAGLIPWRPIRGPRAFTGARQVDHYLDVDPAGFIRSRRLLMQPIIPKRFIDKHGVKHTSLKFGADTEFVIKLIACGLRMRYVPKAMYFYRIASGSMSASSVKHELMRSVLEGSKSLFSNQPDIIDALSYRIGVEARFEAYRPFLVSIKKHKIGMAMKFAASKPWVIFEFLRRIWERAPYELHRVLHKGARRGES